MLLASVFVLLHEQVVAFVNFVQLTCVLLGGPEPVVKTGAELLLRRAIQRRKVGGRFGNLSQQIPEA